MAIYPNAIWRPGPASKTGYGDLVTNFAQGVVCHSMVGYYAGAMAELDKLTRRASWHFSVNQHGLVFQHYDTDKITWHCGSVFWNARLIGIEHEGGFDPEDESFTVPQRESSVKLVKWLHATHSPNNPVERFVK
jgi:N-acetyl-anhydromuramyl-L-alanine amidase AmpD